MDNDGKVDMSRAPRNRGRPSKITDEIVQGIVAYISHGSYIETAVAAQGIARNVFYEWIFNTAKRISSFIT